MGRHSHHYFRHVRELTRARSHRTEWLDDDDWSLTWKKSSNRVRYQKETRRFSTEHWRRERAKSGVSAVEGRAAPSTGCLSARRPQPWYTDRHCYTRSGEGGASAGASERWGGTRGDTHYGSNVNGRPRHKSAERKVAVRWLVGCIPKPLKVDKETSSTVVEALEQSARCMLAAREAYSKARDDFVESERLRAVACRFANRWRRRAALGGPINWAK
eukprot:scaffold29280_cov83-Phaeocystis_antarctica.AAC.1